VTIGGSIALIVIDAILRYAVNRSSAHVTGPFMGLILMVGGAIGLIISLVFLMRRRRPAPARSYRTGSVYALGGPAYTGCVKGSSCRCRSSARGVRDE
jgi:hypothetical protein